MSTKIHEQLVLIVEPLQVAKDHNLVPEVVGYALLFMKENPSLTIQEAMQQALQEWVK